MFYTLLFKHKFKTKLNGVLKIYLVHDEIYILKVNRIDQEKQIK